MSEDVYAKIHQRLRDMVGAPLLLGEPLSRYTTLRVGGPARLLVVANTLEDLRATLDACVAEDAKWSVIGKGSNLLVSDEGYDGVAIQLGTDFRKIRRDGDSLQAGGAAALPVLVQTALRERLGGLAFAVGIPGTVGGAVAGNAGAHGTWIGELVASVTTYGARGRLRHCARPELHFGYRSSSIDEDEVIVEALFALEPADPAQVRGEMERFFKRRKLTQPAGMPSAGSVFKNPGEQSAGKLIEQAGLKGLSVGGAQVSLRHANFIVNTGSASASDVFALVGMVQDRVFSSSGIRLEPEIKMLGNFDAGRQEVGTGFAG